MGEGVNSGTTRGDGRGEVRVGNYSPGRDWGLPRRSADARNSIAGVLLSSVSIGLVRTTRTLSRAELH